MKKSKKQNKINALTAIVEMCEDEICKELDGSYRRPQIGQEFAMNVIDRILDFDELVYDDEDGDIFRLKFYHSLYELEKQVFNKRCCGKFICANDGIKIIDTLRKDYGKGDFSVSSSHCNGVETVSFGSFVDGPSVVSVKHDN